MPIRTHFSLLSLACALALCCTGAVRAEEQRSAQEEAEAKQAAKEDEDAFGKDFAGGYEYTSEGKLVLEEMKEDEPFKPNKVIGSFIEKGRTLPVKVEREPLFNELRRLNGKNVALSGKLRNEGKYFVVQALAAAGAKPYTVRRKRGM